jgi:LAO/AO transport system kinase
MARATERVATLCAGLGFDEILIETVGVGQSEIDVAAAADTTVVVVTPGWGDGVQVAKAGVMEIADIFVVNKADREGATATARQLEEMLHLGPASLWIPPVLTTSATAGQGIEALAEAIADHRLALDRSGPQQRLRERRLRDFRRAVLAELAAAVGPILDSADGRRLQSSVAQGDVDPWSAAATVVAGTAAAERD